MCHSQPRQQRTISKAATPSAFSFVPDAEKGANEVTGADVDVDDVDAANEVCISISVALDAFPSRRLAVPFLVSMFPFACCSCLLIAPFMHL